MAKVTPIQTNFTGGEISPKLLGRVDLTKYTTSCKRLENFIVFPHGGVTKRSGTRFIAEVKDSSKTVRLIPFVFSTVQAYVLEFGDYYVRFYRNEGQLLNAAGTAPYEVATPYAHTELADLDFTQSADVLYLFHKDYAPRKLSRTGATSWTLTTLDFQDGPWGKTNVTTTTLTNSGKTGTVTITASSTTGINNNTGFQSTDVGRLVRMEHTAKWGCAKITAVGSTTSVTATVHGNFEFEQATSTTVWRLGEWCDTNGWPKHGSFYQERFFAAGSTTKPNTVWGSVSGDFEVFSPTNRDGEVLDDSGLTLTISSDQVNAIRWMYSARHMQLGTSDGPFLMSSGRDDLALTPTNVKVNRETTDGCSRAKPIGASKATLYVDRNRLKFRELAYAVEVDGYNTPDLTLVAEHITSGFVEEIAYTKTPDSLAWVRLADGEMRCLTYEREQDVVAWSRHILAGTNAVVKSMASIPSQDESEDQLYLLVSRTIDGATVQYVEFMEHQFSQARGDVPADAFYVDSGLTYDGSPVTVLSGLDHLEGETVSVLVDGTTHRNLTVSSGSITLDRAGSVVHVGLPYAALLKTLDPEVQTEEGPSQGKTRRVERVTFRVVDTYGLKTGTDDTNLEEVLFRTPAMPMGSIQLFTGDKRLLLRHSPDRAFELTVKHDVPQPCTLLAIMYSLVVSER